MRMLLKKLGAEKFDGAPAFYATFEAVDRASHEVEMLNRLVGQVVEVDVRPIIADPDSLENR